MNTDIYGQVIVSSKDLARLLYQNPELDLAKFIVEDPEQYNDSCRRLHYSAPVLKKVRYDSSDLEEFDKQNQKVWFIPKEYQNFDIAQWLVDQCKTEEELQRVGTELLLYQQRDLFSLLVYLKYLVDLMRKSGIVWGVGRGSSVASYILYLIGIHKINSIKYNLNIDEFLK